MIPAGAEHLIRLRSHGLTVPFLIVRLDAEPERVPSWWRFDPTDWWAYEPEIVVRKRDPIPRMDLRCCAGMTVTAVRHGGSDERFQQLTDRLFACGAETVLAVFGESVAVISDEGRRIAA